jgi:hypothetical protein
MNGWEIIATEYNPTTETTRIVVYAVAEDYIYAQFIAAAATAEEVDPNRSWSVRPAQS